MLVRSLPGRDDAAGEYLNILGVDALRLVGRKPGLMRQWTNVVEDFATVFESRIRSKTRGQVAGDAVDILKARHSRVERELRGFLTQLVKDGFNGDDDDVCKLMRHKRSRAVTKARHTSIGDPMRHAAAVLVAAVAHLGVQKFCKGGPPAAVS